MNANVNATEFDRAEEERMFEDMVSRDVKGEAEPEESEWLRKPENVGRFRRHLKSMKRSIEGDRSRLRLNAVRNEIEFRNGHIDNLEYREKMEQIKRGQNNSQRVLTAVEKTYLEVADRYGKERV